jgi:hypothetical protein
VKTTETPDNETTTKPSKLAVAKAFMPLAIAVGAGVVCGIVVERIKKSNSTES